MVLIDVEISIGVERQIETAVLGEKLEHVIEKANAGRNLVPAPAFNDEPAADLRFFRVALDRGASHALTTVSS
jgi:hypothetical protein